MPDRRRTIPARPFAAFFLAWVGTLLLLGASRAAGQAMEPTPPAEPKPPTAAGVREVKPQVYYLKDKDGNLWPVPDMTLEEFNRLYDLARGLRTERPAYTLSSMNISGEVRDGQAELAVDLTIKVTGKTGDWIRIPLRFTTSVLREPPKHEGEGDVFFDFDPEDGGYICWLRAKEESEHKLHCTFVARVQELGAESRLSLVAPRATTRSVLELRVPVRRAEARAVRRTGEDHQLEVTPADNASTIKMLSPSGEFQLAWRAGVASSPHLRQVIEANGALQLRFAGKNRLFCDARLKVSSYGAPLEAFKIRLPPGMRLVSLDQPNMQLTELEPEIDEATQKKVQLIEVRLATKTNGPVEIPLVADYVRENGATDQPIEVGGFEVVDAVKQWGTVDLLVEGDFSAVWLEGASIRRVDDASVDPARPSKSLARFEYDAQPFSLQVQVVPRRTRVSVEPTYVVYVEGKQIRLDATLKYKVRGAKPYALDYDFSGWTIDRVGPETLVQAEAFNPEPTSPLRIPLAGAALSSGEFELRIEAHRDLPDDPKQVAFPIPRPVGSLLTPGNVVIVPADNVELVTRSSALEGLTPDPLPSTIKLPPRQQSPLFFRELGGGSSATFAADMQVREQVVSVSAGGEVRLDMARAQVDQRLTYNIAYEPLQSVELDVPRALWEAGRMQVTLDGTSPPVTLLPDRDPNADPSRARVHVSLRSERIGRIELAVQYSLNLPKLDASAPQSWSLPLVLPILDGQTAKSSISLTVRHAGELDVTSLDKAWATSQPFVGAGIEAVTTWTHPAGDTELPLQLALRQSGNQGSVTLEQAWLQTWLSPVDRQDRAVFRVMTSAERLRIRLPDGISETSLIAAIDGRRALSVLDPEGVLVLNLPRTSEPQVRVVELWYTFSGGRPDVGVMELAAPQVLGAASARRAYWQLILPDNEHLLVEPSALAPDMTWRWRGTHVGRMGKLSQAELERWIGASVQADLPMATNTYLFSTFGSLPTIQLRTAPRHLLLLACSGMALVAGLALLYLPAVRHPLMVLLVGVALAAMTLWSPDLAIIAAQAAILGLACVLLARLLKFLFGRREPAGVMLHSPSLSSVEAKPTEVHPRAESPSQATTATVPVAAAAQHAESEP